jgi:hypothetical protein
VFGLVLPKKRGIQRPAVLGPVSGRNSRKKGNPTRKEERKKYSRDIKIKRQEKDDESIDSSSSSSLSISFSISCVFLSSPHLGPREHLARARVDSDMTRI